MKTRPKQLREFLSADGIVYGPAVYDCVGAMLAVDAGFKMLFTSGFGMSAALLGKPDIGLLTASEIIEQSRRIARAVRALPTYRDQWFYIQSRSGLRQLSRGCAIAEAHQRGLT